MIIDSRYTLEIHRPFEGLSEEEQRIQRTRADLPAMLEEIEENLTDLLPEGWKAVIHEKA